MLSVVAAASFVFVMMAASAVSVMVVSAASARTFLFRKEFPVEAFLQFLFGGVAHFEDLSCEVHRLAGHRRVEIHRDVLLLDLHNHSLTYFPCGIQHRDETPDFEKVIPYLSVDHEGFLRDVEDFLQIILAISFLRGDGAFEILSRLLALYCGLELRDEHMRALDVVQGRILVSFVHYLSFNFQLVGHYDDLVFRNFHIVLCANINV